MKRKLLLAAGACAVILLAVLAGKWLTSDGDDDQKEVTIKIMDLDKNVKTEIFETNATTLTELLKEEEVLQAKIEDSSYGALLVEIGGLKQDMEKGPWLVYESENNTVCKENGMCPALDDVILGDGDVFVVKLIDTFE